MRRLRVLLAGIDQLLTEILRDGLSRDRRLDVKEFTGAHEWRSLAAAAIRENSDVILLGDHITASSEDRSRFLCDHPDLTIMTIGNRGGDVEIHRVRLDTETVANIGMPEIVSAIWSFASCQTSDNTHTTLRCHPAI